MDIGCSASAPVTRDLHCLGCGFDLNSSVGERRLLCSDATRKVIPIWDEIIQGKLQELGKCCIKSFLLISMP